MTFRREILSDGKFASLDKETIRQLETHHQIYSSLPLLSFRRTFTMDNLLTHRNAAIAQLIMSRGHLVIFRAPYYPVDGAIEYV
jgi:transposase